MLSEGARQELSARDREPGSLAKRRDAQSSSGRRRAGGESARLSGKGALPKTVADGDRAQPVQRSERQAGCHVPVPPSPTRMSLKLGTSARTNGHT